MSRWEVKKRRYLLPSPVPPPWVVYDRDNWNVGEFPTHAEALAYADRMARTVEVTLPRISRSGEQVPGISTVNIGWQHRPTGTTFWVADKGYDVIELRPDELRPLALALLALHYQNEGVAGREQVAH